MHLIALLLLGTTWAADTVTIDGDVFRALLDPVPPPPEKGHGPVVAERSIEIERVDDETVRFVARFLLTAQEPGWFEGQLVGSEVLVERVTWNARPAPASGGGTAVVTGRVDKPVDVEVFGTLKQDPSHAETTITLAPAVRGRTVVRGAGLEPSVTVDGTRAPRLGDVFWGGGGRVAVRLTPPTSTRRERLVIGHAGIGLTVGEGELRGKARVQWEVREGTLDRVSMRVAGVGDDLAISGAAVSTWKRSGDRVDIVLKGAQKGLVAVDATWSVGLTAAEQAKVVVPTVVPGDTWRSEVSLQLARDSEVEVVPGLRDWQPVAATDLPTWGQGLVEGTPTAAYVAARAGVSGELGLLRFSPASAPATVVDVAQYTLAATVDGRVLTRAYYAVRNERGAHLRVIPPPNTRIVGVRVGGEPATPVTDGDQGWLVPLLRSVETVEGLLTFPVEVILLGDDVPWDRREERPIALPRLDAPIAVSRVTVNLPRDYDNRGKVGDGGIVGDFTEGEGISYGFTAGDEAKAAVADAKFQEAVGYWMSNEFDKAQDALDSLDQLGAANENTVRLQSNLDLISGTADLNKDVDVAQARRVKEQARARSLGEERIQAEMLREAEEKIEIGDYEAAERAYQGAVELGKKLGKLEQDEQVELKKLSSSASSGLAKAKEKKAEEEAKNARYKQEDDRRSRAEAERNLSGLRGDRFGTVTLDATGADAPTTPTGHAGPGSGEGQTFEFDGSDVGGELYRDTEGWDEDGEPDQPVAHFGRDHAPEPDPDTTVELPKTEPEPEVTVQEISVVDGVVEVRGGSHRVTTKVPQGRSNAPAATPAPAKPARGPVALSRGRGGLGARKAPAPPTEDPAFMDDFEPPPPPDDGLEPLEVTATQFSVVVPRQGDVVRYQHLLLPAGADLAVVVKARSSRRDR